MQPKRERERHLCKSNLHNFYAIGHMSVRNSESLAARIQIRIRNGSIGIVVAKIDTVGRDIRSPGSLGLRC